MSDRLSHPIFEKSMKKTHTILIPSMLEFHMQLFESVLIQDGYKVEVLKNYGPSVVEEGLKHVHNDTCVPALLVIGQFIDALKHRDDVDKVVLIITQTGGGCRASNYLPLLRKALKKAGFGFVPVLSLNGSSLEKESSFKLSLSLIRKLVAAIIYGDELMYLYNKTRSYEKNKGDAHNLAKSWFKNLSGQFEKKKGLSFKDIKKNLYQIAESFDKLELDLSEEKPKVGIVGEIYVKYSSLGNNHLEEFLVSQGAEVNVPGLLGFVFYYLHNMVFDYKFYKIGKLKSKICSFLIKFMEKYERVMIDAVSKTKFEPMQKFSHTLTLSEGFLSHATKMGEGWLLTAEMIELVQTGYENIVCTQPFGCLPNHICGKGVMKKIKEVYSDANIVAIDYDPSATKVNQENRIKLMLEIARENIEKRKNQEKEENLAKKQAATTISE